MIPMATVVTQSATVVTIVTQPLRGDGALEEWCGWLLVVTYPLRIVAKPLSHQRWVRISPVFF